MCVCVCVVLRRFQHSFNHITTVAVCCMRRDSAQVLSAANTDAHTVPHTIVSFHCILTRDLRENTRNKGPCAVVFKQKRLLAYDRAY